MKFPSIKTSHVKEFKSSGSKTPIFWGEFVCQREEQELGQDKPDKKKGHRSELCVSILKHYLFLQRECKDRELNERKQNEAQIPSP